MTIKTTFAAAVAACLLAVPAFAESVIAVEDAYARSSMRNATTGAAFMTIQNSGDEDDQLIDARSDVAKLIELHTHKESDQGVMQMIHVPEGFTIPAGGSHALARGGDHVMFMGLNGALVHGETVSVTLVFEKAGEIIVEIPVDLERKPKHGMGHGKGHGQGHGQGMKMQNQDS